MKNKFLKSWREKRRGKRVYKLVGKSKRKRLVWLDIARQKWMNTDEPYEPKVQWIRKNKRATPLDEVERRKKHAKMAISTPSSSEHLDVYRKQGEMLQTESFKPGKLSVEKQMQQKRDKIFKWLEESRRKRKEKQMLAWSEDSKKNQKSSELIFRSEDYERRRSGKRAKTENKFVTKVLKNIGGYICELRQKTGESAYSRYLRLLSSHKSTLVEDSKEFHTGSRYKGQFSPLGMDGSGNYHLAHGPIFEGFVIDGKFEGSGRMIYPNGGVLEGTWSNGVVCNPHYMFSDGLHFDVHDWRYCQMPDRRFQTEIVNGLRAPLNVQLANNHPAREIPLGCLDAGEGFYDPRKHYVLHPVNGDVIRIPSKKEGAWMKEHCRKAWDEYVPFKRGMYENWFQGSKFYLEEDESVNKEWYNALFPSVKICDTDLDEVVLTRAGALRQSIIYASKEHEMDYPTKITEALPFYADIARVSY